MVASNGRGTASTSKDLVVSAEGNSSLGTSGALRTLRRSDSLDHHLNKLELDAELLVDGSRFKAVEGEADRGAKRQRTFSIIDLLRFGTQSF